MTDPGAAAVTPQEAENMKKMFDFFLQFAETNRSQEGGASSSNLFNVPEKMAGRGAKLPEQIKYIPYLYRSLAETFYDQERRTGEGAASSSGLGGAPANDKKTLKKKKKDSNGTLAALKKKDSNGTLTALKKKESSKKLAALKKKESNKELAALKKKAAQEKAKYLKTVREMEKNQLMESIKKHKEMVEKRRLLIQKNKEKLKKLHAKKH